MGSAQFDMLAVEEAGGSRADRVASQPTLDLKQQVAERLAAHRQRRSRGHGGERETATPAQPLRTRHSSVAAAVAERYAQTPSYRAFLAEEAQRAIDAATRQAENAAAEAEVAARNAHAITAVQQQLLSELELWDAPQEFTPGTAEVLEKATAEAPAPGVTRPSQRRGPAPAAPPTPVKELFEGLTVRLYEDIGRNMRPALPNAKAVVPESAYDLDEALALDDEIAFRQSPVFEPFSIEPPTPLPANLLEFPRQLVAARKARPRLAEGPLREDAGPRSPQLRIFEVEPEQISTTPVAFSMLPEWASIRLDAHTITEPAADADAPALLASMLAPETAPMSLRVMAGVVDLCLVGTGFLGFTAVAARIAGQIPSGIPAVTTAVVTLGWFYVLYQALFFTFSDQTPGMRYARIGLCMLSDENPSRSAMRRRILAQMIAVCPFGLGILWALLDDDGLGWHDRISRMYQRAY